MGVNRFLGQDYISSEVIFINILQIITLMGMQYPINYSREPVRYTLSLLALSFFKKKKKKVIFFLDIWARKDWPE